MTTAGSLASPSFGPPDGPSIVFLHGGGVGGWMWQPVIQHLPEYHCLAPDQPEHGASRSIGPFSIELAASKVAELIRDQCQGKAHVVGLSQGAQITVQLLATAPQRIEKAIVSSALVRAIPGFGWASSPALVRWLYRLTVRPLMDVDWWLRLNMKYAGGVPEEFYPQFKQDFQQMTESEFANVMVTNQRFRMPSRLERVTVPTLVLAGRREYTAMKQSARDLVAVLPRARGGLVNLGKGTSGVKQHNWALTAPKLFAETVRAWIEGQSLPPEIQALEM